MASEKEKMLTGKLYFSADPELVALRRAAREKQAAINATEDPELRSALIKAAFGQTGEKIYIEPAFHFDYGENIRVGENFYANFNCTFLDVAPITIGKNCLIGPNVQIYTAAHPLDPVKRNSGLESGEAVTIGDNVWIGGNAVILPGILIGDDAVIGAGSVVTKDVEAGTVVRGNPARVTQTIPEENLAAYRRKIDQLDRELVALLEARMEISQKVGRYKKTHQLPVLDEGREKELLEKLRKLSAPEYQNAVTAIYQTILQTSRELQHHDKE
ncbi:chorismate mutase [Enterococcus hirae]|nr:chorismate mutase [Enterococcus hirae]